MQLNDIRILSTRPLPDEIIFNAAEKGITMDTASFIKTEPVNSTAVIEQIKLLAAKKITAVFTSVNAVEVVTKNLSSKPGWKIFCMGGATKELVIDFFGAASIAGTARDSNALAEKIVADKDINEAVFFCGDQRLEQLPEMVRTNKIDFKEVVVYATIQTPQAITKEYAGIVFFSPSAVHSFFDINTIATDVIVFAIGKTTAAAVHTYVNNELITSKWPGKEQMIEQVIQYFERANSKS